MVPLDYVLDLDPAEWAHISNLSFKIEDEVLRTFAVNSTTWWFTGSRANKKQPGVEH